MKRIFLLLITAIAFGVCAMAQDSRVATLQHGSNFRAYYGTDAFVSAHSDASDGDIITLTEGEFNCPDISKAITVRGEGEKLTLLKKSSCEFNIPKDSPYSLCLEGLKIYATSGSGWITFFSTGGSATAIITKCIMQAGTNNIHFKNCNAVILNSWITHRITGEDNSSVTCINSRTQDLSGKNFDVQNCVVTGMLDNFWNSTIKNSIIYGVSNLDKTICVSSHCLVKEGSSGFTDSWYVKTEPDVNPDPWGEDPETPVLWADLFGADYHLTEAAAATYVGTDGTEVGIYGGAYPYNETPDYPLVKNLEVKGIQEDGKLTVKINVK